MKTIDEIGNQYGLFRVIARDTTKINRAYWICKCTSCGYEKSISGTHLRKNEGITCPQCEEHKNVKDEKGKIYGNLLVLEKDYVSDDRRIYWKCKCQKCGNIITVSGKHLRDGSRIECHQCYKKDHPQYIDETGNKYGKLTVLGYDDIHSSKTAYWWCQCSCGNIISIEGIRLRFDPPQSCGCVHFSKGEYKIAEILKQNNIIFEPQKTFDTCRFPTSYRLAYFDFYLPIYNTIIEYDGEQHFIYKEGGLWHNEEQFEKGKERDEFKNQWCKDNNIILIRIPYTDFYKLNINYIFNLMKNKGVDL